MKKNYLKPVLALALVVALMVSGTLAFLRADVGEIENKFIASDDLTTNDDVLAISLAEVFTGKDAEGVVTDFTKANNIATVNPGDEIVKQPTVTVEACDLESGAYVFINITDENKLMDTFGLNVDTDVWTPLYAGNTTAGTYYMIQPDLGAALSPSTYTVFDNDGEFTVGDNFTSTAPQTITVDAFAIQKSGYASPYAAWLAL